MRIRIAVVVLLAIIWSGLGADFNIDLQLGVTYSDNVYQLSDDDLGRFEDGSSTFDFMESSDDMILLTGIRFSRNDRINKQLSVGTNLKVNNRYFASNKEKSRSDIMGGFGVDYRDFSLDLAYGYYPGNYLRDYTDKDGTGEQEKFEYDKNLYRATLNYRVFPRDLLMTYVKYEEYYHNEFFTENDGPATTLGVGWKHTFVDFYLKGFYYFRRFECDNVVDTPDEAKDGSYESNIYSIDIETKKVRLSKATYIRPYFSFDYEDRHFQTDLEDNFHANRHDQKYTSKLGLTLYAVKNLDISIEYCNIFRESDSDFYTDIAQYKEYLEVQGSLMFEYRFEWREGRKKRS